jgi:hypothetical protein
MQHQIHNMVDRGDNLVSVSWETITSFAASVDPEVVEDLNKGISRKAAKLNNLLTIY